MTTDRKLAILFASLLAIVLMVGGRYAIEQHLALTAADTVAKAANEKIASLQSERDERDALDKISQQNATTEESGLKSSADAVRVITRYLPAPVDASKPEAVTVDKAELPATAQQALPDAPSYVIETQSAALSIARNTIQCEADRKSLTTCQQDLKDADAQRAAETGTAQAYKTAAKGGTVASRTKAELKCALIGGAGAAGGANVDGVKGAGIGALVAYLACKVF